MYFIDGNNEIQVNARMSLVQGDCQNIVASKQTMLDKVNLRVKKTLKITNELCTRSAK